MSNDAKIDWSEGQYKEMIIDMRKYMWAWLPRLYLLEVFW